MTEKIFGDFGFEVEFGPVESCQVSGAAWEITAHNPDGSVYEKEHYLKFTVKWDGCAHWNFGEEGMPGYLHTCEPYHLEKHCRLIQFVYGRALKMMKDAGQYLDVPVDGWEWMKGRMG